LTNLLLLIIVQFQQEVDANALVSLVVNLKLENIKELIPIQRMGELEEDIVKL